MQELQRKYDNLLERHQESTDHQQDPDREQQSLELVASLRLQLSQADTRVRDLTEDKKRLSDHMLDLNIDL